MMLTFGEKTRGRKRRRNNGDERGEELEEEEEIYSGSVRPLQLPPATPLISSFGELLVVFLVRRPG